MTIPLRRMNPRTVIADLFTALGEPVPPALKRMSKRLVVQLANDVIVANGGDPIPRGSSFADTAAALQAVYDGLDGDDRPDWVPANATHHIDLVRAFNEQDAAWTLADGVVAVDTLLGADENTENWWGSTEYDPEGLTANGYVSSGTALIGAARTKLLSGCTYRIKEFTDAPNDDSFELTIMSASGNAAIDIVRDSRAVDAVSDTGDLDETISNIWNYDPPEGVGPFFNCVAGTITSERFDLACNGSDPISAVLTSEEYPTTGEDELVAIVVTCGERAIQTITLYDALPSTAGLSALSETGVVNTAPHDFSVLVESPATEVVPFSYTVPASTFAFGPGDSFTIVHVSAEDDEGNPITYSLSDDDDGAIILSNGSSYGDVAVVESNYSVGVHTFTLRATDPGGLYVEQEFTITVTA